MSYPVTRLYYYGRLMNTIDYSSTFRSMPHAKVDTPEAREAVCQNLIQGWVQNANYESSKFRIEHGQSEPVVLSKMAQEMIQ